MTQRERIASGLLFTDMAEGLPEDRLRGKEYAYEYNHTRPTEVQTRIDIARKMFGAVGKVFWIEPPIHFAYGSNIFIGENFYANVGLTIIDDTKVVIGDNVMIAANVTMTSSPKTGPEKFEFSGGRSSPKKEENRDEKETQ